MSDEPPVYVEIDDRLMYHELSDLYTICSRGGYSNFLLEKAKNMIFDFLIFLFPIILLGKEYAIFTIPFFISFLFKIIEFFILAKKFFHLKNINTLDWKTIVLQNCNNDKYVLQQELEKFLRTENILLNHANAEFFPNTELQIYFFKKILEASYHGKTYDQIKKSMILQGVFYIIFGPIYFYRKIIKFAIEIFGNYYVKKSMTEMDFTPYAKYRLRNINETDEEIRDRFLEVKKYMKKYYPEKKSVVTTLLSIMGDISLFFVIFYFINSIIEKNTLGQYSIFFYFLVGTFYSADKRDIFFDKSMLLEKIKTIIPRFEHDIMKKCYNLKLLITAREIFAYLYIGWYLIFIDVQKIMTIPPREGNAKNSFFNY